VHALTHRRRFHAEHVGDFGGSEFFQVAQHERTAIEVWEPLERRGRPGGEQSTVEQLVGARGDLQLGRSASMNARRIECGQIRLQCVGRPMRFSILFLLSGRMARSVL
jgi:hypothetical protein